MSNFIHRPYKGFWVEESGGKYLRGVRMLNTGNLPKNEVLIKVQYSSLNYKDALSATGNKGVTKKYPHTPGIDAAGVVAHSENLKFEVGERVIVSGYDLGMNTPGGFAEYIAVPADWVVKLPENLSTQEAMILGTAGFTAGISISRITSLVKPSDGKIVVTGATGGVGSVAVNILHKLGYQVVAVSGKKEEYDFLKKMGAEKIIDRDQFLSGETKPILTAQYAGGIDTVGGKYLEQILKSLQGLGAVTTCGSVSSTELNMSVFPFILRGISLIGISAQNYPMNLREILWNKLSGEWKPTQLMNLYTSIEMDELNDKIDKILQGKLKGRTIVHIS
ncbi:MAG: YhdH/YhfP family quinone oxidoreductase [Paludibacteraceae bacterium]